MHRVALALLVAAAVPAHAQSRVVVDSLVARITHAWGIAPRSNWCAEWSVVRGDSTALSAAAEISGSDRAGIYTVIVRREKFAAPVLVGRLRVGYERAEPVTAHAIARGTILTDADVLLQHTLTWGAPDSELPVALASIIGAEARRTLRDGEPIRAIDVASAPVVFAGDTVTAEIIRDGVRLALVGTALHNASLGARVAIRLNRGRRFAGIATGRNTVRLD
jgi:flagella basal body P-ring formation protein FlgA